MSKSDWLIALGCVVVFAGAVRHTAAAATFQRLGYLDGGVDFHRSGSVAYAVSADGTVVVGSSYSGLLPNGFQNWTAFRWTAEGSMVDLGFTPVGTRGSEALAVSTNGDVVVGNSGSQVFLWTAENGMTGLGDLPGGNARSGFGSLSLDGKIIVGYSSSEGSRFNGLRGGDDYEAFRWAAEGGMVGLGDLPGGYFMSRAAGMSADGKVVVGLSSSDASEAEGRAGYLDYEAFRWTSETGMVGLGDLPGGKFYSLANAVSSNGKVIIGEGTSDRGLEAFRWTEEEGMVPLFDAPAEVSKSSAYLISSDGSVVVGTYTDDDGLDVFRWTLEGGMAGLGLLPGVSIYQLRMSDDGSVIIGRNKDFTSFIWTSAEGMRDLEVAFRDDFGFDLAGLSSFEATGISADGLTIVGSATTNPGGGIVAWIATIPEPGTAGLLGISFVCILRRRV